MWRNYLFFVTPDCYIVSLDARTGEERWHKELASFNQQYFCTSAPTVVENHVIVGTGNDLDSPGYLAVVRPQSGDVQWKFYSVPMNPGDPGLESWKDLDAARNGGGHPGCPAPTIRKRGSISSAPATRRRRTPTRAERATTCSRTRSSP